MSVLTEEIKKLDEKFDKIRLEEAVYDTQTKDLKATFLLSRHFNQDDEKKIEKHIAEKLPFANVKAELKKSVCDPEIVKNRILSYIASNCAPIKERVNADNFVVSVTLGRANVEICAEEEICSYFKAGTFENDLSEYLKGFFCEDFSFSYAPTANSEYGDILAEEKVDYARIEQIPLRYFNVENVTRLFDNNTNDRVMYIADACDKTGELTIAGKVVGRREKLTKTGKPFFILDFNDGTGRMSGSLFTNNKDTLRKMEKVQEGSEVIVLGDAEITDNGYHRFNIKSINFCCLPANFIYEERVSRRPPETYALCSPSPMEEIFQTNMFAVESKIPECLKGTSFVVVDLETTGTSPSDDRITEIGAVKMVDGKITEKFSTMVNPERKIPENVVELTGITDDMVKDAPNFEALAGDIYKFCYGSVIIAHNIAFDYTFLKNQSKAVNYIYSNRGIDTLALSRTVLPDLSNHKLNTVCEKFGIEFLHHRAYSDAFATAQMFIELIKLKGSLPEYDV